jgi:hypothetical protein
LSLLSQSGRAITVFVETFGQGKVDKKQRLSLNTRVQFFINITHPKKSPAPKPKIKK